jgi:hypothetical protein
MLEVQENKSSLKYDQELVLTNVYVSICTYFFFGQL